ncbi:MAG: hypothetical protein LLG04_13440 [Parachlamydia sp.]|nr:hypothetical protein [Parachlamydia sp.]
MDVSRADDPTTHLQKSTPYQTLLPLMQWLFESKTDRLSKEDEEALASALCLFSLDTALDDEFHQEALPLVSATRALLPVAWSRLAAFPLTVETFLPELALLALKDREVEWTDPSFPTLPDDAAYTCLRERLKTIADRQMCCALLLELSLKLAIKQKLPPLTSKVNTALQTWIVSEGSYVTPLSIHVFAEHPELKLLLPKKAADIVVIISGDASTAHKESYQIKFWNAVSFLIEAGYLKGIDAAASIKFQDICLSFDNQDFSKLSYELTASIHAAIMALNKHNCLNQFPKEMLEEVQKRIRAAMDQLLHKITSRVKSFVAGKLG